MKKIDLDRYHLCKKRRNDSLIKNLFVQDRDEIIIFDNYEIVLCPNVFNPLLGEGTILMRDCKKYLFGKNVLELGTGTGILSIMSAEKSEKIIATDISNFSFDCAKINIKRFGLDNKIEIRKGDLFEPIKNEVFDKIIFNPPFINGLPKNIAESSFYDYNYKTLTNFFINAKKYLTDDGEIILCFGSVGDINYLNWLITINNFTVQFIENRLINDLQFFVYKISVL